jgi:hypothetical protein
VYLSYVSGNRDKEAFGDAFASTSAAIRTVTTVESH